MSKRIAARSMSLVVVATLVPSAIAANASEQSPPVEPLGIRVSDTGISKVRSGKAVIRAALPKVETERESLRVSLQGFGIEGDSRLMPEALDQVLAPWKGRNLSFAEYEEAIHAVAEHLRENGHPGAQVRMSRAIVGGGKVMIAIEGLNPDKPTIAAAEVKPRVDVKGFKFTGVTLAQESELNVLLADFIDLPLTAAEMEQAAQTVAKHLRAKGYPLVQAYLPPQRVDTGVIEIAVQEGRLDEKDGKAALAVVTEGKRIKPEVMEEFLTRGAQPGTPLRMADLERAVLLASDLPGIKNVKTQIEPGEQAGTTQLKVDVEEKSAWIASLTADNFGNRYTGESRVTGQIHLNSPAGYGEQYQASITNSKSMNSARLGFSLPLGRDGWRLGASYTHADADFGLNQRTIDLNSKARVAGVSVGYPIIRSAMENVHFSAGLDSKRFVTDLTWGQVSDRKINVGNLALSGDVIDPWGGQVRWSQILTHGNLDLSADKFYRADDRMTAKTEGAFTKLNFQFSRLANIGQSNNLSMLLSLSGQYANKNLDSAEKFQLGGPNGVRAYPASEGMGDRGMLFNAELRYKIPQITLANTHIFGFYDYGRVTQFVRPYRDFNAVPVLGNAPNNYKLQGAGIGLNVAVGESGSFKVMWANKIGDNPKPTAANTDSDGTNKSSRVWIVGNIVF